MTATTVFTKTRDTRRLRQIFAVLAKYGYGHFIDRLGLRESPFLGILFPEPGISSAHNAERMRCALEELGPTFIKLGQILSTRPELIPMDYINEFSKLQDNVPPFSVEEAGKQIKMELGADIEEIFPHFDPTPVASASLSQVHKANLGDGTSVAIKIQRPGIKPLIESDIDLMYFLARLAERSISEVKLFDPRKVVREFERSITKELDFTIEAANAERFRTNFNGNPHVHFPRVYNEFSGKRILTMDFIEGVKITDAPDFGYDPKLLARRGLEAVVQMIFRDGFFHADPHPGNVFVSEGGRLIYVDLGLAGRVSEDVRDKMLMLLLAIIREDFEEVAEIFYKIGIKEKEVDILEFRRDVIEVCEKHFGKPLKYMELGAFLKDIFNGIMRHRITIPPEYALMCRALITMEGVGKKLDPEINIFKESQPQLLEIFKKRFEFNKVSKDLAKAFLSFSSFIQETPPQIKGILDRLESGNFKVRIEDGRDQKNESAWEKIINRLILTIITSSLVIFSVLLLIFGNSAWATLFGVLGFLSVGFLGLWLTLSILRSGRF